MLKSEIIAPLLIAVGSVVGVVQSRDFYDGDILPNPNTIPPVMVPGFNQTLATLILGPAGDQFMANSQYYCTDLFQYLAMCIKGQDMIKKYCEVNGFYCHHNANLYYLFGLTHLPCNTTMVTYCPYKHYCPNPFEMYPCPAGYYCRTGVTKPKYCVFGSFVCPDGAMGDPITYKIASILLAMFITFILSYEYFMYKYVQWEERYFRESTSFKPMIALEQEGAMPAAQLLISNVSKLPSMIPADRSKRESRGSVKQQGRRSIRAAASADSDDSARSAMVIQMLNHGRTASTASQCSRQDAARPRRRRRRSSSSPPLHRRRSQSIEEMGMHRSPVGVGGGPAAATATRDDRQSLGGNDYEYDDDANSSDLESSSGDNNNDDDGFEDEFDDFSDVDLDRDDPKFISFSLDETKCGSMDPVAFPQHRRASAEIPTPRSRSREQLPTPRTSSHDNYSLSSIPLSSTSVRPPDASGITSSTSEPVRMLLKQNSDSTVDSLRPTAAPGMSSGESNMLQRMKDAIADPQSIQLPPLPHLPPLGTFGGFPGPFGLDRTYSDPSFTFHRVYAPVNLDFYSLRLTLKSNGKVLLRNICGYFKAGQITAIMGSSGCGKTSLLAVLRGQAHYAHINGVVRVNGKRLRSLQSIRNNVAFVPQDDILYDELTVHENVLYAALLFNRRGLEKSDLLHPMVSHALEILGIRFISSSVVGSVEKKGISGGQRRRVSVAMEMVKEAGLFLLDEPTSGLDSATSISLMNCLHSLASLGTNVVTTLHQPRKEIFDMLDNLMLLAPGGRVAYFGPARKLRAYFYRMSFCCPHSANVADFVMDVMSGFVCMKGETGLRPVEKVVGFICDRWEERCAPKVLKNILESSSEDGITNSDDRADESRDKKVGTNVLSILGRWLYRVFLAPTDAFCFHPVDTTEDSEIVMTLEMHRLRLEKHREDRSRRSSIDRGLLSLSDIETGPSDGPATTGITRVRTPRVSPRSGVSFDEEAAVGLRVPLSTTMSIETLQQEPLSTTGQASTSPSLADSTSPTSPQRNNCAIVPGTDNPLQSQSIKGGHSSARNSARNSTRSRHGSNSTGPPAIMEMMDEVVAESSSSISSGHPLDVGVCDTMSVSPVEMQHTGMSLRRSLRPSPIDCNSIASTTLNGLHGSMSMDATATATTTNASQAIRATTPMKTRASEPLSYISPRQSLLGGETERGRDRNYPNHPSDTYREGFSQQSRSNPRVPLRRRIRNFFVELKKSFFGYIRRLRVIFHVACSRQFRVYNRSIGQAKQDCSVLFTLGCIISLLFGTMDLMRASPGTFAGQVSSMQLTFGLLIMGSSLRIFGSDVMMRKREEEGGFYVIPYYLGKLIGQLPEVVVSPLAFLFGYYSLATPGGSFFDYWLFTILLYLEIMGMANLVAVIFPVKGRALIANGLLVVLWAFGGITPTAKDLELRLGGFGWFINSVSPFKWTFEFQMLTEFKEYSPAFSKVISSMLNKFDYSMDHFNLCVRSLLLHIVTWNGLAVLWLLWAKDNYKIWRRMKDNTIPPFHRAIDYIKFRLVKKPQGASLSSSGAVTVTSMHEFDTSGAPQRGKGIY